MEAVHERRRSRQAPDAVTVEDLLAAQDFDLALVDTEYPTEPAREPRTFLSPPRPQGHPAPASPEPESRLAKAAKLAGLSTAASLLVGAVVASALLARERPAAPGHTAPAPPAITGTAALGGFASGADAGPSSSALDDQFGGNVDGNGGTLLAPQIPVAATRQAGPADGARASSGPADKLAVVAEFYRRISSPHPENALTMLVPSLAGNEPGRLIRAWASMKEVNVEQTSVQPDGSVRAVVIIVRHDETTLRVTQVLTLAANAPDVIAQAQLISAEQL